MMMNALCAGACGTLVKAGTGGRCDKCAAAPKACARGCGSYAAAQDGTDICRACRGSKQCVGKCANVLPSWDPVELCLSCRHLKPCATKGCPSMVPSAQIWRFCDLCTRKCAAAACGRWVAGKVLCPACERDAERLAQPRDVPLQYFSALNLFDPFGLQFISPMNPMSPPDFGTNYQGPGHG
jgi:hypothetical protein